VIVTGDLTQSLGAPVKRGDLLYEVAPAQQYRLRLKVDERDITGLALGQRGAVRLASLPGSELDFEVGRITPVSATEEGKHFFYVEAHLDGVDQGQLSPGMTGIARVHVGERSYLWIWFHRAFDRARLWYWRVQA